MALEQVNKYIDEGLPSIVRCVQEGLASLIKPLQTVAGAPMNEGRIGPSIYPYPLHYEGPLQPTAISHPNSPFNHTPSPDSIYESRTIPFTLFQIPTIPLENQSISLVE